MDSPSDITYSRAPPEDTGVRSCDGHANLMALAQEDRRWPHAELQFGRLSGNKRLGVVAGNRGWAQLMRRTAQIPRSLLSILYYYRRPRHSVTVGVLPGTPGSATQQRYPHYC